MAAIHYQPVSTGPPLSALMARRSDDERAGGGGEDDDRYVDVPVWVTIVLVLVVAVVFLIGAIRGKVDPELYGLVALALTGAQGLKYLRRRKL